MKRWITHLTIASYLTVLGWGVFSHAFQFHANSHPMMYFVVWDMFCGWAAHEARYHLIGEGESGAYYELAPGPWGAFTPFGDLERRHYDTLGNAFDKIALNTLRHTEHEPITRMYVVEEYWPKQYNLPDHLYQAQFGRPKEPYSYYWVKTIYDRQGRVLSASPTWLAHQYSLSITDNPRLHAKSRRGQPFIAVNPRYRSDVHASWEPPETGATARVGLPLGN